MEAISKVLSLQMVSFHSFRGYKNPTSRLRSLVPSKSKGTAHDSALLGEGWEEAGKMLVFVRFAELFSVPSCS